jgi:hypothetical protein
VKLLGDDFRTLMASADELDRLRAVLEAAPHSDTCTWPYGDDHAEAYGNYCSCWKAEAQ